MMTGANTWIDLNNNPTGRRVGDCSVRAVSVALGVDWETAYAMIAANGFQMGDVMSSDAVFGSVLREHGFYRETIPNSCPMCYTSSDFCKDNPIGTFVLGFGGHVATVKNGKIYDSWDSSNEIPIYVWYKQDHPPFKGGGSI